ncbi:MAG TPA: hypothetical protein PLO14_05740 [Accumulibacter sp.]|uniref:hypothetical protein n=1 Tax=Accumulibacter sp. TaxID=2053492 RepID=UPI0025D194A4|nr:hypothetical protein [Accumulibacter sp.]MCM8600542.1 hypothetical protein [Accumulibacter sp.]MCM8664324.1 hypothetical protein [Accumulibacter sp.]HNC51725.1 hypothetical protein [Accumulibacter sp.]
MKAHVGVDTDRGQTPTMVSMVPDAAKIAPTAELLYGEAKSVRREAGYTKAGKREDSNERGVVGWGGATKLDRPKAATQGKRPPGQMLGRLESVKLGNQHKVEYVFGIVRNLFGHRKVCYRGWKQNAARVHMRFALANLCPAKRPLPALSSRGTF